MIATHTCDGSRVVHMPLGCVEPDDTLAGEPDNPAAIRAALRTLGRRTNGRPGEVIGGLLEEYGRIDADLRKRVAAACQGWSTPCEPSQEAAYHAALAEVRAANGRLRDLRASVEDLAGRVQWVEPTDEAAKGVLSQLEKAAEELAKSAGR